MLVEVVFAELNRKVLDEKYKVSCWVGSICVIILNKSKIYHLGLSMLDIWLCRREDVEWYRWLCYSNLPSEIGDLSFGQCHVVRKIAVLVKLFIPTDVGT
jgi:hypothetical protein